ncbi:MAG: hypothetical protein ACKO3R_00020 [bacterium]
MLKNDKNISKKFPKVQALMQVAKPAVMRKKVNDKDTRIQIPISSEKKRHLELKAENAGFDSVTDVVRFLINNFLQENIKISLNSKMPSISLSNEEQNELLKSLEDKKQGKVKVFNPKSASFHKSLIDFAEEDD